jgi:serine/threonine protein kinase/tetratricopeptide (TPR) repeat protein
VVGRTLAHYEITELLGKGGMGEVYRARDLRLKREVALKILPADMAADPARLERFQREAETVAALNHPHIVTLFSVEEDAGVRFLTMELVEGRRLDEALTLDGLPLAKILDTGIAVAGALAAAHEKGIVHRDLKPANVMISKDGRVKVLDFGLAKLFEPSAPQDRTATQAARLTIEGTVMGTVPYMSPEQLRGQKVGPHSDIFSLGILLYEMTTGQRPFGGTNNSDITSSILRDTPPLITQIRPDVPQDLARIVALCLEKEPRDRYRSALDIRNELRSLRREVDSGASEIHPSSPAPSPPPWVSAKRGGLRKEWWIGLAAAVVIVAVAAAVFLGRDRQAPANAARTSPAAGTVVPDVDPHSISVLPFVDMSQAKDQEYFSDGVSEELLSLLSKVPELKVAARTSSFSFKGKEVEIPEIGRRLHVAYVLEGSVRKSGNQVRITAQLIHAADGFHLWSQTYDHALDDIFKIQDDIAAEVVTELKVTLLGAAPKARTTDPQGYALYLQARQLGRQVTAEAFARSDALYRQVLEFDPRYAPAWVGLANNFINKVNLGALSYQEGFASAREADAKALAIDPEYAPAHAGLGWLAMYGDNDLAGAAREFERALTLDPTNLDVRGTAASLLQSLGRLDESLALREAIVRRDPVNVVSLFNLGITQIWAGRFDEAIASLRSVLSLSPGRGGAHYQLGTALLLKGDAAGALKEIEQETSGPWRMVGLPMAYHALGRKADSNTALTELIAKDAVDAAANIASVYAFRGEADKAFEWLDRAVEYHDTGLAEIGSDILFTNLRSDPRWLPFLRKLGKAPDQLAKIEFKIALPK